MSAPGTGPSNFTFVYDEWPGVFAEAYKAERYAVGDPRTSSFYARRALEQAVEWVYDSDGTVQRPYRRDISALIDEPTFTSVTGPAVRAKMDVIRRQGNNAVHRRTTYTESDSVRLVGELFHVLYWMARTYSQHLDTMLLPAEFDRDLLPRPLPPGERVKRQAELKQMAEAAAESRAALTRSEQRNAELDAQIKELQDQVKAVKAANAARLDVPEHDYDEKTTRSLLIDVRLREAGWDPNAKNVHEYPVSGMPITDRNKSGTGKADYVLWDDDGKPLAVVEAKRSSRDATEGRQQAKLYADCLQARFGQRPVIFYTNGYVTWLLDDHRSTDYPAREVLGFYTKDELRLMVQRRAGKQPLRGVGVDEAIVNRNYQAHAIRRVGEAFEADKRRRALLVMATGSGKTRTIIALIDQLARAGWVKRVLFLADRKELVRQAHNAFKTHLPGLPSVNLLDPKSRSENARVFVSTYPTMMNLINETNDDGVRRFGPGFFDLIIVDEAHRSIYQKFGVLFSWFDGLLLGLTATPKDEIDRNTYRTFHLEEGAPTDVYGLDEAVADGYLVPPKEVKVPLRFMERGIKYADLSQEERDAWDELEWSDDGTAPTEVSSDEMNRVLFVEDTVDKAIAALLDHGLKVAGGDRLAKTIIFAKNNDHAEFIAKRIGISFPHLGSDFARVITHKVDYAETLIDKFKGADRTPHIAISVDMLDTGIDVPEVANLVFFKPVRSKTKFWQMIGRGTRLCKNLFGPNQDKDGFLVFDLCGNFDFFDIHPDVAEGRLTRPLSERVFTHRVDLLVELDSVRDSPIEADLRRMLAERLSAEVRGLNVDDFVVRPHLRQVEIYADIDNWHRLSPERRDDVAQHLAPLAGGYRDPSESEHGEEARRFDLVALKLQLGVLGADPGFARLRDQVKDIATILLEVRHPDVDAQVELLEQLAGDDWWDGVTVSMLETMRKRVRGLVRHIERAKRSVVYADFRDELGEIQVRDVQSVSLGLGFNRFKQKVRTYLRSHENDLAVQKIKRNRQLTQTDLGELEKIFLEAGFGTESDIGHAKSEHDGSFGLFLRSLTGLDHDTAKRAFDSFQSGRSLSGSQLHFVNLVIDALAKNGTIDPGWLYDPPFSSLAPGGPEDLFGDSGTREIVSVLRAVSATARAA